MQADRVKQKGPPCNHGAGEDIAPEQVPVMIKLMTTPDRDVAQMIIASAASLDLKKFSLAFRGMTIDCIFEKDVRRINAFWFRYLMLDTALSDGMQTLKAKQEELIGKNVAFVGSLENIIEGLTRLAPCNCVRKMQVGATGSLVQTLIELLEVSHTAQNFNKLKVDALLLFFIVLF